MKGKNYEKNQKRILKRKLKIKEAQARVYPQKKPKPTESNVLKKSNTTLEEAANVLKKTNPTLEAAALSSIVSSKLKDQEDLQREMAEHKSELNGKLKEQADACYQECNKLKIKMETLSKKKNEKFLEEEEELKKCEDVLKKKFSEEKEKLKTKRDEFVKRKSLVESEDNAKLESDKVDIETASSIITNDLNRQFADWEKSISDRVMFTQMSFFNAFDNLKYYEAVNLGSYPFSEQYDGYFPERVAQIRRLDGSRFLAGEEEEKIEEEEEKIDEEEEKIDEEEGDEIDEEEEKIDEEEEKIDEAGIPSGEILENGDVMPFGVRSQSTIFGLDILPVKQDDADDDEFNARVHTNEDEEETNNRILTAINIGRVQTRSVQTKRRHQTRRMSYD